LKKALAVVREEASHSANADIPLRRTPAMLSRVLEPELMDTPEEARDYDTMDHGHVNRLFVDDLLVAMPELMGGTVTLPLLDLGTGTAQIPIELCSRVPQVLVHAGDAAAAMLAVAAENVARAQLSERIRLEHVDAKRLSFADRSFAAVISNSIIHHIPEPRTVIAEAVRVTAADGLLFFRDLLRPADRQTLDCLVDTYAAGANAHQRRMFAESLHAALSLEEIQSLVVEFGFARETVRTTSDRHWTWIVRRE
jgi:ubiquinone/menaquinone biosynthesis C-methylase UbiE